MYSCVLKGRASVPKNDRENGASDRGPPSNEEPSMLLSRRHLLRLTAATAALGAAGAPLVPARGTEHAPIALSAESRILEVDGKPASVYGLARPDGVWGLDGRKGDPLRVRLTNRLDVETLIHWHGLTPPSEQDGVPGLSQPALPPGRSYDYDFVHTRAGTFWMHSHVGFQEQQLLAAPLIVRALGDERVDEQEVVVLLHDFTFRDPQEIYEELRGGGMTMPMGQDGDHGGGQGNGQGMSMDHGEMPMPQSMAGGDMAGGDGHGAMVHYNDVDYDAYLANDRTLADPEVIRCDAGGQVRLRVINAASASNFVLELGGLEGELIAVDGNPVKPIKGEAFDLAIAQRLDVRLRLPAEQGAYPILAQREDDTARTGIVLATKDAQVHKLMSRAHHKARPLSLDLEHSLSAMKGLAERVAERTHVLDLTGRHEGYVWGLNGMGFDPATPLLVAEGERVEVILRNRTGMPHPMHLHGHHFQVVAIDGRRFAGAVRDTVLVPPERSVTIAFEADNPGHWAFHCHQIYHMAAGMMTSVKYEGYERAAG